MCIHEPPDNYYSTQTRARLEGPGRVVGMGVEEEEEVEGGGGGGRFYVGLY